MLIVPIELSKEIVDAIDRHFDKPKAEKPLSERELLSKLELPRAEKAAVEQGTLQATWNDSSGPFAGAITVESPLVRPWLRILIAQEPRLLNIAVLSEKELSA
jgi:hypothetical protein